jgi:hypothetical protein
MASNKRKKASADATAASVQKEMAKPRITKSARIAESKLVTKRISERPSITTMLGTVTDIIPSPFPGQSERAQIGVDAADHGFRDLRIENTLTDEHGDDVRLKKGARVDLTVTARNL